jgi:hypothetical protein
MLWNEPGGGPWDDSLGGGSGKDWTWNEDKSRWEPYLDAAPQVHTHVLADLTDFPEATENEMTTGTEEAARVMSPLRVAQAVAALADAEVNTTNVTAAGALMDSEVANLAAVKAFDPADYATEAQGTLAGTALQPADFTQTAIQTAITDNAAFLADVGAVATTSLSTNGGASKVPQFDASGNITTGPFENDGDPMGNAGNIFIPDLQGIEFLRKDGTPSGQKIYGWDEHGGAPGTPELIVQSPTRIALIAASGIQIGPNDPARYPRYVQMVSGGAASQAAVQSMESAALFFQTKAWNGSASVTDHIGFQAEPLDDSGSNSTLKIYDQAWLNEAGFVDTVDRGKMTGNPIAEIYKAGIWSAGTAPAFNELVDEATITQTCSKYKTIQAATVTITDNRALIISGALAGMRGVIYVTQDSTGSRTLTPSGGSALDLTTGTGDVTDKVSWEYDGIYFNYSVAKDVQREVMVTDDDALSFIAAAGSVDPLTGPEKAAVSTLVASLKTESLWGKFYALYPFIGGDFTAHAQDLKGTYPITHDGSGAGLAWQAATHDANGVTGNGSSAYGNTGVNFSTLSALNSASLYIYNKSATPATGGVFIGAFDGTRRAIIAISGTSVVSSGINSPTANIGVLASGGDMRSHIAYNRSEAAVQNIYGYGIFASNTDASTAATNFSIAILARGAASMSLFSNANLGFAAIGQSLTSGEWATFRSIIDTFQAALGRANP